MVTDQCKFNEVRVLVNTLKQSQNGCHFTDVFKCLSGDKPLSEPMMGLSYWPIYFSTLPQWVNCNQHLRDFLWKYNISMAWCKTAVTPVPSHYLIQCWNIVNLNLKDKLQSNLKRNSYIFIQENAFENAVCKNGGHLVSAQCANWANYEPVQWSIYTVKPLI